VIRSLEVAYGLGSMNQDLPGFLVLLSRGRTDQPLYDRLWGSGFLPTRYQGVKLRGGKEPVLYLANPAGCSSSLRRQMLEDIGELNQVRYGIDHTRLTYKFQGRDFRLTDVHGRVVQAILA